MQKLDAAYRDSYDFITMSGGAESQRYEKYISIAFKVQLKIRCIRLKVHYLCGQRRPQSEQPLLSSYRPRVTAALAPCGRAAAAHVRLV